MAHSLPSLFFTFLGLTPDNRPTGVFALLGPVIRMHNSTEDGRRAVQGNPDPATASQTL